MKKLLGAAALMMMIGNAQAQQPTAPPQVQALYRKLGQEVDANIACNTQLVATSEQLTVLQARVKELEEKYEPKKPDGKKN